LAVLHEVRPKRVNVGRYPGEEPASLGKALLHRFGQLPYHPLERV
jgi:hypothetical protein